MKQKKKISAVFFIHILILILLIVFVGRIKLNIIFVNNINFAFSSNRVMFCVKYMIHKFQLDLRKMYT